MKTIWKWSLGRESSHSIDLPLNSKVLSVQVQDSIPCMWILVDPKEKRGEARKFNIYGTGHEMPDDPGKFIGTFQIAGGTFIFHLFEEEL